MPTSSDITRKFTKRAILEAIFDKLTTLERKVDNMAISQEQFDADLAALVTAVGTLATAIDAFIASHGPADFTPEETQLQTAAAAVQTELAKLTPPPAP